MEIYYQEYILIHQTIIQLYQILYNHHHQHYHHYYYHYYHCQLLAAAVFAVE